METLRASASINASAIAMVLVKLTSFRVMRVMLFRSDRVDPRSNCSPSFVFPLKSLTHMSTPVILPGDQSNDVSFYHIEQSTYMPKFQFCDSFLDFCVGYLQVQGRL